MATSTVPITVLTGFLGSGKTTVLNHLLHQPDLEGTVAIINEFGEIGLDHLLVESTEEEYAILDNGCVCCTVRSDLLDTLNRLAGRDRSDDLPKIRRIVIETTGLADPVPILHSIMAEASLQRHYHIDGVVTTVDAANGAATLENHEAAIKQIALADRLLITKTDLVNGSGVENLKARLQAICPTATCQVIAHGEISAADILGARAPAGMRDSEDIRKWFAHEAATADHTQHSACSSVHNPHDVQSYSFAINAPVDWQSFNKWLEFVVALKGEDLLRLKGLVNVAQKPGKPMLIHGVQHVFHPPEMLDEWPSDDERTRLIFIVRNIPRDAMKRSLIKFASIETDQLM